MEEVYDHFSPATGYSCDCSIFNEESHSIGSIIHGNHRVKRDDIDVEGRVYTEESLPCHFW